MLAVGRVRNSPLDPPQPWQRAHKSAETETEMNVAREERGADERRGAMKLGFRGNLGPAPRAESGPGRGLWRDLSLWAESGPVGGS